MAKIKIDENDYDFIRGEFLQRVHDDITAGTSKGKKVKILTTNTPTPDHEDHPAEADGDHPSETLREKYRRLLAELKQRRGANDGK